MPGAPTCSTIWRAQSRTTGVSPDWVFVLIVVSLIFALASIALFAAMVIIIDRTQPTWFLRRLWHDRAR